jgi:Ca2+-dependent lipid-binding protein
MGCGSSDP